MAHQNVDLISQDILEKKVEIVKAIAHHVRLQIVNILMNGESSVGNLVKMVCTKQSLTSQQLSILKLRGILKARRKGNVVYYSLENNGIKNIIASILAED